MLGAPKWHPEFALWQRVFDRLSREHEEQTGNSRYSYSLSWPEFEKELEKEAESLGIKYELGEWNPEAEAAVRLMAEQCAASMDWLVSKAEEESDGDG